MSRLSRNPADALPDGPATRGNDVIGDYGVEYETPVLPQSPDRDWRAGAFDFHDSHQRPHPITDTSGKPS